MVLSLTDVRIVSPIPEPDHISHPSQNTGVEVGERHLLNHEHGLGQLRGEYET